MCRAVRECRCADHADIERAISWMTHAALCVLVLLALAVLVAALWVRG